nr:kinesin motor domain-containing protein [Tanacetum cinerariifolium]
VNEMEEELERYHRIRDSLEVELQSASLRLLTVKSFRNDTNSDNNVFDQPDDQISRKLHSRYLELQEAYSRIKDLKDEIAKQANEIKQCKEYISELVIHAEAQA